MDNYTKILLDEGEIPTGGTTLLRIYQYHRRRSCIPEHCSPPAPTISLRFFPGH